MAKEYHIGIVTRNVEKASGKTSAEQTSSVSADTLRGGVYFEANTLLDGEYPLPADPPFGTIGQFWVPEVGDSLLIELDEELDNPRPRVLASWYNPDTPLDDEFKINYPNRKGWITRARHQFLFDDTLNEELVRLRHTGGTGFDIDPYSDFLMGVRGDLEIEVDKLAAFSFYRDFVWWTSGNFTRRVVKDEVVEIRGKSTRHYYGGEEITTDGTRLDSVGGEVNQEYGLVTQNISGSKEVSVGGGIAETCGGSKSESIISNRNSTVGGNRADLIAGTEERTVGLGRKTTIATVGEEVQILAGQYLVNLIAGAMTLQTQAGTFLAGNPLGNMAVDPAGNVIMLGTTITLGAPLGQVLTNLTAPIVDTITGAPHIGVPTLLAG